MSECDCSEEYGPCERHSTLLVVREGASLHTADELTLILAADCVECGAVLSADHAAQLAELNKRAKIDRDPHSGCMWFTDPDDSESAQLIADTAESNLPDGIALFADDGYRIVRVSEDCPLREDVRPTITSVWSSYGHRFIGEDSDEAGNHYKRCLTCGALYQLAPRADDPTSGDYVAIDGSEPMACTGRIDMAHGYPGERETAYPDMWSDHNCNCLFCDS